MCQVYHMAPLFTSGVDTMQDKFILLPAVHADQARLLKIPQEISEMDAYRRVTSLIAAHQERTAQPAIQDMIDSLADEGFVEVPLIIGPHLS